MVLAVVGYSQTSPPLPEKIPDAVVVVVSVSVSVASVVTAVSVGATGFIVAGGLAGPGIAV